MKCTQSRVCTLEEALKTVREDLPQPVGIVLFGADCEFKSKVVAIMVRELGAFNSHYYFSCPDCASLSDVLRKYPAEVVIMDSDESGMHDLRHELVKTMRNAGAKTVVGIYAKVDKVPVRPLMSSLEKVEFNKQITAIKQSNPNAEGLDYYIEVENEEEEG